MGKNTGRPSALCLQQILNLFWCSQVQTTHYCLRLPFKKSNLFLFFGLIFLDSEKLGFGLIFLDRQSNIYKFVV